MIRNQERIVLDKLKENGLVYGIEIILNHGILPWTLKKIIKSLKNKGYRISIDKYGLDNEYKWADYPHKW